MWANRLAATGRFEHDPNPNGEGENLALFQGGARKDCTDAMSYWQVAILLTFFKRSNSDLSQTSHCNSKGLSVSELMRIENMITQVKFY